MQNYLNYKYKMTDKLSKKELLELLQKQSQLLAQKDEQIAEQKKVINNSIPAPPKKLPKIRKQKPVVLKKKSADEVGTKNVVERKNAMKNFMKSYEVKIKEITDPRLQLNKLKPELRISLLSSLVQMKGIKFVEALLVGLQKMEGDKMKSITEYFFGKPQTVINPDDINNALDASASSIMKKIDVFTSEGSGWTIKSVDKHFINIAVYKPLEGSSYIKLPKELSNSSKGLINIKNDDNQCFRWCHIRHINPQEKNPQRIKKSDRDLVDTLDYSGITFPVQSNQYNKIEKQNNININVLCYCNGEKYPIYISKEKYDDHMNLLLLNENPDDERITMVDINDKIDEIKSYHYVLIKDFNSFMYDKTKNEHKKYYCMSCLQHFPSESRLESHKKDCMVINGVQAIKMPEEGSKVKFENYKNQIQVPYAIYADSESILEKVKQSEQSDDESYTEISQKHIACGFGYKVVCQNDEYSKPEVVYRGEGSFRRFLDNIYDELKYCIKTTKYLIDKYSNIENCDTASYVKTKKCCICDNKFAKSESRGAFYCQITGKSQGTAHRDCIDKVKIDVSKMKIPIVFHNLRNYDSHFIIQELGAFVERNKRVDENGKEHRLNINVIPNNLEKYMAFMLGDHLVFIDSFQFMSSGLDKLISNLPLESLKYTKQCFGGEQLKLVSRKGVYPYEYMDSFNKFDEKQLPSKESFYSSLKDEHISDDDYKHAQTVWKSLKIKNMGDYHDLYLKTDVLLLADVFENFRKTCLEYYNLDPCHYFTSPGLSWDAMLKMTNIKLDLISDIDMYLFIEKGMRGGISYIANRYSKANNKYMKNYNMKEMIKYIMYLDANNLYGWAMIQHLPTGGFKWLTDKQIETFDLNKYENNCKKGIMLEVDLEYPKELHDLHNDYPLAPEKIKVKKEMLSEYCKNIAKKYDIKTGLVSKLIPTLCDKKEYVLHYRNLQLYLDLGLKLKKIHRVLEFDQSPWLKPYIDFNTEKRTQAKNSFEKDFFKLMNNSVFGKTMENVRKRVNVDLITDPNKLKKIVSKPTFTGFNIITGDLVAVSKTKEVLTLNRPSYVGMAILDLSKYLMYDFHYNYIKKKYQEKAKLLFTDTDSLTYEIVSDDVYSDFWDDRDYFDFSDNKSPFNDPTNKKVIGKFKDEAAGIPIIEFVGLRSKMYSYKKDNGSKSKKAKGIKKSVINGDIKHENYMETLFDGKQMRHKMKSIRSKNHVISTYNINKVSLSCFDDKRFILEDGIKSLAYGHYRI